MGDVGKIGNTPGPGDFHNVKPGHSSNNYSKLASGYLKNNEAYSDCQKSPISLEGRVGEAVLLGKEIQVPIQ